MMHMFVVVVAKQYIERSAEFKFDTNLFSRAESNSREFTPTDNTIAWKSAVGAFLRENS